MLEQEAYAYLNLTPHEFYEFTPQEYSNMLIGYRTKREIELKDKQYQAWFNANFVGAMLGGQDIPSLEEIMKVSVSDKEIIKNDKHFIETALRMGLKVPEQILKEVLGQC